MKRLILLFSLLAFYQFFYAQTIDKEEAQQAFNIINSLRVNTKNYIKEYPFLKNIKTANFQLKWNDTLAKVAEAKAKDMAKRNYFNHINPDGIAINYQIDKAGYKLNKDWLKDKKINYFESISAGSNDAQAAIKRLIIDTDDPTLGHRYHLLGLNEWNASLLDIGIGFVRADKNSEYKTYMVIIIAKHDW